MTTNLLNEMGSAVGSGRFGWLSGAVGERADVTDRVTAVGLPAILGGLSSAGSTPGGATQLMNLIRGSRLDEPNALNSLGAMGTDQSSTTGLLSHGRSITGSIFGSKMDAVSDAVGEASGTSRATSAGILSMLAPIALAVLGKRMRQGNLDADQMSALLRGQHEHLAGVLPGPVARLVGLETLRPHAYTRPEPRVAPVAVTRERTVAVHKKNTWWPWAVAALLGLLGLFAIFAWRRHDTVAVREPEVPAMTPVAEVEEVDEVDVVETAPAPLAEATPPAVVEEVDVIEEPAAPAPVAEATPAAEPTTEPTTEPAAPMGETTPASDKTIEPAAPLADAKPTAAPAAATAPATMPDKDMSADKAGKDLDTDKDELAEVDVEEDIYIDETPKGETITASLITLEPEALDLSELSFAPTSATLDDSKDESIDRLASALKASPTASITLTGLTDDSDATDTPNRLSFERAANVRKALIERGVDENRIQIKEPSAQQAGDKGESRGVEAKLVNDRT